MALTAGLKLGRLCTNHIDIISFIHTSPFATTVHFCWKFAKSIFSFLVLAFLKAAEEDGLVDSREPVCTITSIF